MAIVTWNPSDSAPGVVFTNGNLTLTVAGGTFESTRATLNFNSPLKMYMEHSFTVSANCLVGVGSNAAGLNGQFTGQGTPSIGYQPSTGHVFQNSATVASLPTAAIGDVICQAWIPDLAISTFFIRINNGNWNGSPSANPATNTGGIAMGGIGGVGGGPYPMASGVTGSVLTSNFGATAFSQAIPAGFGSPNNPFVAASSANFFFAAG